jgi:hypothetical protein
MTWTLEQFRDASATIEAQLRGVFPEKNDAWIRNAADAELLSQGCPDLAAFRQQLKEPSDFRKQAFEVGRQFMALHPDTASHPNPYRPTQQNEALLHEYLADEEMPYTLANLEMAYAECRERLEMPERRTRTASQVQRMNNVEISHESLDRLSARQMEVLLQNPRAVELINALPPRQ